MYKSRNFVYLSYEIADMRMMLLQIQQQKPNLDDCSKLKLKCYMCRKGAIVLRYSSLLVFAVPFKFRFKSN